MNIRVVKHINKEDRIEYLLVNFDYFDGNDLLAKLFAQEFQMSSDTKIDGVFYSIIRLHKDAAKYDLIWHEDIGNYIVSAKQDKNSLLELEQRLKIVVGKLNEILNT